MPSKSLFPIPSDLTPTDMRCVQINIPDDPQWESLFWGSLDQLQLWNSYARTGDTQGKQVADVWKGIIEDAQAGISCGGGKCFNWKWNNFDNLGCGGSVNSDGIAVEIPFGDVCLQERIIHGAQIFTSGPTQYRLALAGLTAEDSSFCGGPVFILRCHFLSQNNSPSWSVDIVDCSGTNHHYGYTTAGFILSSFESQQICVNGSNPFWFYAEIGGDYTCLV